MIVPADTIITCSNGHEICKVLVTTPFASTKVLGECRENQRLPADEEPVDTSICGICGSPWARATQRGGIAVHTARGWTDG
jgi:hypothetical protein